MPYPIPKKEEKRRLSALNKTKRKGQPNGSISEAARSIGISPGTLSKWLLNNGIKVGHEPATTKEECIAAFKAWVRETGKIPARDDWKAHSSIGIKWRSHWPRYEDFIREANIIAEDTKILLLDIETAPNRAYVWGTWKQNINPEWIDANGYVLCWTAKWLGEKENIFHRLHKKKHVDGKTKSYVHATEWNHRAMLEPIHNLLHEASAVIHYNGSNFDIPTLNKEFLMNGFTPPSPYKQIDLLRTMREGFRFPNNKLDYIVKTLSIGEKLRHTGPQLWLDCMKDDADAWSQMEAYNRRDVDILERLYHRLLPWIKGHPNLSAMHGAEICPACGSNNIKRDKDYLANFLRYPRYHCSDCGTWIRANRTNSPRVRERLIRV